MHTHGTLECQFTMIYLQVIINEVIVGALLSILVKLMCLVPVVTVNRWSFGRRYVFEMLRCLVVRARFPAIDSFVGTDNQAHSFGVNARSVYTSQLTSYVRPINFTAIQYKAVWMVADSPMEYRHERLVR